MSYTFSNLGLAELIARNSLSPEVIKYPSIFSLPVWMEAWWQVFGRGSEFMLAVISHKGTEIGIAPLKIKNKKASFIGDSAVCDYLDFIIKKGEEAIFFKSLLDELKKRGIISLELEALRYDSAVIRYLKGIAEERGFSVNYQKENVSVILDLPENWQDYVDSLSSKQRHEIKRKTRRLMEHGAIEYQVYQKWQDIKEKLPLFLKMFTTSRRGKADFLTNKMELFFKKMVSEMALKGFIGLGFLKLNKEPVASVMYFDYNNTRYLYNSGYNPQYRDLSVGLLSKVFCISDAIKYQVKVFDFLGGSEVYKYRLGGREIPLYKCRIDLDRFNEE